MKNPKSSWQFNLNNSVACKFSYILHAFFFLFHTITMPVVKQANKFEKNRKISTKENANYLRVTFMGFAK